MLWPVVPHQIQQLVFQANDNPFEFYVNEVLSEYVGSTGISCCVPKHSSCSQQVFNLAVSFLGIYLQPGFCICIQERGWDRALGHYYRRISQLSEVMHVAINSSLRSAFKKAFHQKKSSLMLMRLRNNCQLKVSLRWMRPCRCLY